MAELVKSGNEVTVITTSIPNTSKYERLENGIQIYRIGRAHPKQGTSILVSLIYIISGLIHLKQIIKMKFDIIESNTYLPCYLACLVSKVTGIPHIMTIHDTYLFDWSPRLHSILIPFAIFIEKALRLLRPDRVVTVSRASKAKIIDQLDFENEDVTVIHNGVAEDIDNLKLDPIEKQIIYIGRIIAHKHVDHLILAFKEVISKMDDWRLIIVGEGPEIPKLQLLVSDNELSGKVTFTGFLESHQEVYRLLGRSSLLVNPSTVEGFGIVLLEAMAMNVPVVAYDIPAYRDFAIDGENVVLVKPNDINELALAILAILNNSELANKITEKGKETAKNFSWSSISERVIRVYKEELQAKLNKIH